MPLQDYLSQSKITGKGLSAYLRPEEELSAEMQTLKEYGYEVPEQKGWSILGKKFMNVVGGTLDVLRTGEYAVGGILAGKGPITGVKEKISPGDALGIRKEDTKWYSDRGLAGLAADILLDPTTYLTFGTAGVMKLATKGGQVAITKGGRNLIREIIEKGASEAAARRTLARVIQEGGEKAAQKYIGKDGLKFMGQVFIPKTAFGTAGKMAKGIPGVETAGKMIGKVPGVETAGKVGNSIARAFVPFREIDKLPAKLGGKGAYTDALYRPFERQTQAEIFKDIDKVKDVAQKAYKERGIDVGKSIGYKIETQELTEDKLLDDIIKWINTEQKDMLEVERGLGKKIGEIPGYLRHYLGEEGKKFTDKGGDFMASLSKGLRAKLKAGEQRKLVRVISETGKDVTWDKTRYALKPLKEAKIIDKLEDAAQKKISSLQKLQKKLAAPEITMEINVWKDHISALKKHISKFPDVQRMVGEVAEFDLKEFDQVVKSITNVEINELAPIIKELEDLVQTSQGREFLFEPLKDGKRIPRQKKVIDIEKKIKKVTNELSEKIKKYQFFDYTDQKGNFYKTVRAKGDYKDALPLTIKEINDHFKTKFGVKEFFIEDAFKAFALRKAEHIKFVNTHKFLEAAKARFGTRIDKAVNKITSEGIELVESSAPQLKGWLLPKPIVEHLDDTLKFLSQEETTNAMLRGYDKMIRFWKMNVTGIWPAFHTRNFIGGYFNNWLAGVKETRYLDVERMLQGSDHVMTSEIGTKISGKQLLDEAERFGVSGQPGMMDVYRDVEDSINAVSATIPQFVEKGEYKKAAQLAKRKGGDLPRWAMEQVENRLRLPLYLDRRLKGFSPEEAAKEVFKYHFDYVPKTGLTSFERETMKRLMPFYVWTRNNVPLQIEQMLKQPGKYAGIEKFRQSMFTDKDKEEFKYLPEWMQEMFVFPHPWKEQLGKSLWMQLDLPLEDINKLPLSSSSIREIGALLSPFLKLPTELYMNRNLYFGGDIANEELPREMQTTKAIKQLEALPNPLKKFINFRKVQYRDWSKPDEKKFLTRYEMSARALHILRSTMGRYYSTLQGVSDEDIPAAWKVSRHILGIPVRSVDIEEEKESQKLEQEKQARAMLTYLRQHNQIPYKSETNKMDSGLRRFMGK